MLRPRVIPVLLLRGAGLVKTTRFGDARYVGDPLNAVRIFDEFSADELVLLDIDATRENRTISPRIVESLGEEANMPFAVGGGLRTLDAIHDVFSAGAEKVVIGTCAVEQPDFIAEAAAQFGSSSIVVCIDVKRSAFGIASVRSRAGTRASSYSPVELARLVEQRGAGEIIVQSIDRDGERSGYDLELVREVADAVSVPVIALGGAGSARHLVEASRVGASAVAAGSLFVLHGGAKGVLLSYPTREELAFA
jgi:imidazole glycerol-phosphate synthase subunit HisF